MCNYNETVVHIQADCLTITLQVINILYNIIKVVAAIFQYLCKFSTLCVIIDYQCYYRYIIRLVSLYTLVKARSICNNLVSKYYFILKRVM